MVKKVVFRFSVFIIPKTNFLAQNMWITFVHKNLGREKNWLLSSFRYSICIACCFDQFSLNLLYYQEGAKHFIFLLRKIDKSRIGRGIRVQIKKSQTNLYNTCSTKTALLFFCEISNIFQQLFFSRNKINKRFGGQKKVIMVEMPVLQFVTFWGKTYSLSPR